MKKVLLTIISVCLIAASIFGLFAGVSSFSDIMNVKEYKRKGRGRGVWSPSTRSMPALTSCRRTRALTSPVWTPTPPA